MKNKITKTIDNNRTTLLLTVYWVFVFVALVIIKKYSLFASTLLISSLLYIPYRMFVVDTKDLKDNVKKSILTIIIFLGVFNIYSLTIKNNIQTYIDSPELFTYKFNLPKVVSMKNFNIHIDENNEKAYIYYKVNGVFGRKFIEVDNLVEADKSEYPIRYGEFHKIDENIEIAFPTYKNELSTEYLFKVTHNNREYILKAFVPFENCFSLIKKANFKQILNINTIDNKEQVIYLNIDSKEVIISDGEVAVSSKYFETPYDKNDYFSYRYEIFKNNIIDDSKITKNVDVSLMETYHDISNDIKRVTFYSEGTEQNVMYGICEIIFEDFAYVFRTGIIDTEIIQSITRA